MRIEALRSQVDERERKVAAVLAYSQTGSMVRSTPRRIRGFEAYLRSRPDSVLEDLYRSLPSGFGGGR